MRHDVTFPLYVEVDEIYNLACPASPIHYQYDPVQTTKTSVHGAINMLGLAKRAAAPRSCRRRPPRSTATPTCIRRPRTTGATSIRSARAPATTRASAAPRRCSSTIGASTGCASRWRASSTPTARACIRTTAGWCRTSSCRRCSGEDITIYGDGAQTRSFCYVDDLIDGLIRLMETRRRRHRPDQPRQPERVHHPRAGRDWCIELTGSRSQIVHRPLPQDDPRQRQPDISQGARSSRLGADARRCAKVWPRRSPISMSC